MFTQGSKCKFLKASRFCDHPSLKRLPTERVGPLSTQPTLATTIAWHFNSCIVVILWHCFKLLTSTTPEIWRWFCFVVLLPVSLCQSQLSQCVGTYAGGGTLADANSNYAFYETVYGVDATEDGAVYFSTASQVLQILQDGTTITIAGEHRVPGA